MSQSFSNFLCKSINWIKICFIGDHSICHLVYWGNFYLKMNYQILYKLRKIDCFNTLNHHRPNFEEYKFWKKPLSFSGNIQVYSALPYVTHSKSKFLSKRKQLLSGSHPSHPTLFQLVMKPPKSSKKGEGFEIFFKKWGIGRKGREKHYISWKFSPRIF